jgi:hypothetical protein
VLAGVEDPEDSVEQLGHRSIGTMDTYLGEAGGRVSPEEANALGLIISAAKANTEETDGVWARRVQQVCDKLVQGKEVDVYYRILSEKCHVGLGSAESGMLAAFSSVTYSSPSWRMSPTMTLPRPPC